MGPVTMGTLVVTVLNGVLLVALTGVWLRNYRAFESRMVLGLVVFGVALLFENVVAVYFYVSMHSLYAGSPVVELVVGTMRALQFVGVAVLASVSLR